MEVHDCLSPLSTFLQHFHMGVVALPYMDDNTWFGSFTLIEEASSLDSYAVFVQTLGDYVTKSYSINVNKISNTQYQIIARPLNGAIAEGTIYVNILEVIIK